MGDVRNEVVRGGSNGDWDRGGDDGGLGDERVGVVEGPVPVALEWVMVVCARTLAEMNLTYSIMSLAVDSGCCEVDVVGVVGVVVAVVAVVGVVVAVAVAVAVAVDVDVPVASPA